MKKYVHIYVNTYEKIRIYLFIAIFFKIIMYTYKYVQKNMYVNM